LFRDHGDDIALSKKELGRFISINSPVRLSDPELDALTHLLDFDSNGNVEIDSLVTILKTSSKVAPTTALQPQVTGPARRDGGGM
jgi:hypothetical protein